ncbi:MAG: hypothetical protein EAY66_05440 [Sphingobacteriales bacterium]|nr:MAG: hypothetical protein EAY66_05440 [Sphingobacteriales bacterium]
MSGVFFGGGYNVLAMWWWAKACCKWGWGGFMISLASPELLNGIVMKSPKCGWWWAGRTCNG